MPDEEKIDAADRTFADMWRLFFEPEIGRRKAAGTLPEDFSLYVAQALFPPSGANRVLLNEQVRGEFLVRSPRELKSGEPVYIDDLQHAEVYELPDELLDHGHFTLIRAGDGWRMIFNFLSGRAKAKDMLELANQFLEAARFSGDKGHAGPAVDNLFSASELVSKAELILHRSLAATSKKHSMVASEINSWARLGNIDAAFVALFNKLGQQRPNARYGDRASRPPVPDHDSFVLVEAMIERGLERVGKATERALLKSRNASTPQEKKAR